MQEEEGGAGNKKIWWILIRPCCVSGFGDSLRRMGGCG